MYLPAPRSSRPSTFPCSSIDATMKKILTLLLTAIMATPCIARQIDTLEFTDEFLDTVVVNRNREINNYSTIGVNYGVTFSNMDFNPSKHNRAYVFQPNYFSIMYTHYEKLFDYMPLFAFSIGFDHGYEGVSFKTNKETGRPYGNVDGADWISMEVYEIPAMAKLHFDAEPLMLTACVGLFGGYRTAIERRAPDYWKSQIAGYEDKFRDYEYHWDYGMQAGAGLVFLINPFELHIDGLFRWGWTSLYEADYYSPYYYRFTNAMDIMVSVGIHYQLTKRSGRTSASLRREAKEKVYGRKTQDPESQGWQ